MFQGLENEILARTAVTFLAEAFIALVIALSFWYFGKIYNRPYLRSWSVSWLSFFVASFCTALLTAYGLGQQDGLRLSFSILSQIGHFLQVYFLFNGLFELISGKVVRKKVILIASVLLSLAALATVLAYYADPDAGMQRYIFRVIVRYFLVAISFMIVTWISIKSKKFTRGIGQTILTISFALYAFIHVYYCFISLRNVFQSFSPFPFFFGMVEMVVISTLGIGMVIWLLEDERNRLDKINRELDSFLYSTSHDLRAPIASILGLTNLAKLETLDEKSMAFISMIEERTKKLDLVIGDILLLSKSKKIQVKITEVDFDELIKSCLTDLKFQPEKSKINFLVDADPAATVKTDVTQLKIILTNLIGNAIKYHQSEKADAFIRISFKRLENHIEISVTDNGSGISKESLPKIFDMFYRASEKSSGTGLGLYIVKESLSRIHGKINVTSEENKGTSFTITLPA